MYNNKINIYKKTHFATWNATGIMSSASYISDFLEKFGVDICGISEHWLFSYNLHFLGSIHNQYDYHAIADPDLALVCNRKVGKGGLCLLWKKSLSNKIAPLTLNCKSIVGIQYKYKPGCYYFVFQVYAPCSNHSLRDYKTSLEEIENILHYYGNCGTVILMGDFNGELPQWNSLNTTNLNTRSKLLCQLNDRLNLVPVNCLPFCEGPKFSNVPYNGTRETLIDYIFIPQDNMIMVDYCSVHDDHSINVSTHRPISCGVQHIFQNDEPCLQQSKGVIWKNVKMNQIEKYTEYLNANSLLQTLLEMQINNREEIDYIYNQVVHIIKVASNKCIPTSTFKPHIKPYWDENLSKLHKRVKSYRQKWISENRPRDASSSSYIDYKSAKREF